MASSKHLGETPTLEFERKTYNSIDCVEQLLFIEVEKEKFGGYKQRLLVSSLNEMQEEFFVCHKCKGLMRNACQIGEEQTPVCEGCAGKMVSHPMKRSQKMIPQLQVHCPLSTRGCVWNGIIAEIEVHIDACAKFIVKCPNACDVILPRNELNKHLKQSCVKRIVDCGHCQESVMYKDLTQHYDVCVEFPLFCPNHCEAYLMRKQVNTHIDTDCPNTLVECPYRKFGCEQDVKRCELEEHKRVNEILHLQSTTLFSVNKMEQMEKKMVSSDNTVQRMEKEITQLKQDTNFVENKIQLLKAALESSLYPVVLREAHYASNISFFSLVHANNFHAYFKFFRISIFFKEDIENCTISVTITMKYDELRYKLAKWPFEGRFKLTIHGNTGTQSNLIFESDIVQLQPEHESLPKGGCPSSHVISKFNNDDNFKRKYMKERRIEFTLQMQDTQDKSIMESMENY